MTAPAPARSYLGRLVAPEPMTADELDALRSRAWIERGVVCVHVDELAGDDWLRARMVALMTQRFGRRMRRV